DVDRAAQCLGVSVRTRQRRLIGECQSFSKLLNETRRDLVVRYLRNSDQSITAVAELTGYAALSSFTRWFISEFGLSPKKWRKIMQSRDSARFESGGEPAQKRIGAIC